jgi:hypothetical protein
MGNARMWTQKIDRRLREEIDRLEQTGASEQMLSVIIEAATAAAMAVPRTDVNAVETDVQTAQAPLRQRLADMGVTGIEQMTLANALVARLTPAHVRALASDPAVKRMLWNVAENVTL